LAFRAAFNDMRACFVWVFSGSGIKLKQVQVIGFWIGLCLVHTRKQKEGYRHELKIHFASEERNLLPYVVLLRKARIHQIPV
jgi:hypothetical protein